MRASHCAVLRLAVASVCAVCARSDYYRDYGYGGGYAGYDSRAGGYAGYGAGGYDSRGGYDRR